VLWEDLKDSREGSDYWVAGCVAQQEGSQLLDRIPYLDMVIGTHAIPRLPQLLQKIEVSGKGCVRQVLIEMENI